MGLVDKQCWPTGLIPMSIKPITHIAIYRMLLYSFYKLKDMNVLMKTNIPKETFSGEKKICLPIQNIFVDDTFCMGKSKLFLLQ